MRPHLLLSLGKEVGTENDLSAKAFYPAAFSIELVHTYSLIHDDLPAMDDDTYRRGRLSHHAKYGEASAVLAGDGLLTLAFQILAENYESKVLKKLVLLLSVCSGNAGMIGGQVLDCLTTKRDEEIFRQIHILKTGKLFSFAFAAAGIISGLPDLKIKDLESLGLETGLLFQLQDDLLDEDKKGERSEENILSVVSKKELLKLIKVKKKEVQKLLEQLKINKKSQFYKLVQTLFDRKI